LNNHLFTFNHKFQNMSRLNIYGIIHINNVVEFVDFDMRLIMLKINQYFMWVFCKYHTNIKYIRYLENY
jgi:hypothetical protein